MNESVFQAPVYGDPVLRASYATVAEADRYRRQAEGRARRIARTETLRAQNEAVRIAAVQAGSARVEYAVGHEPILTPEQVRDMYLMPWERDVE